MLVSATTSGVGRLHLQPHVAAHEVQAGVAGQRPGQQAGFAQHLETVADSQDRQPTRGGLDHLTHHRREPGDCAGA